MIYKPTDLSPSAQTFDVMDTPIFFECKVDTSNVQASGFTIEILDSENNVVFSSIPEGEQLNINYITIIDDLREYVHTYFPDYESGYSLLNTGYNGSYLKFPFSVAYDSRADNTSAINQIFYIPDPNGIVAGLTEDEIKISSGLYRYNYKWTTGDNPEYIIDTNKPLIPVKIYNGKEYKWSITLYQLENKGTIKNPVWILPENPLIFDMPMTIGNVLGSNDKRIQSVFSEEIYSDYFIQPLKIEGLNYTTGEEDSWTYSGSITQIGSRVAVKSYDMSFGYIYPVEGDNGFQAGTIKNDVSNAFRIYKNGNDPENLTAYQKVNFVANKALDEVMSTEWTPDGRAFEDGTYGYKKGNVVLYNNNIYQCEKEYNSSMVSHVPGKNDVYWEVVSDNSVDWWTDGKTMEYCRLNSSIYKRSDKIPYIYPELESDKISDFDSSIIYYIGDIVKNTVDTTKYYKCIKKTTTEIEITNPEYWETTTQSPYWTKKDESIALFAESMTYNVGTFVKNSNKYYECIKKTEINITDTEYWKEITINEYNQSTTYNVGVVVKKTNASTMKYYKCIKQTTTGINITNTEYWEEITINEYNKSTIYNVGVVAKNNNKYYKCIKKTEINITDTEYWKEITFNEYKNYSLDDIIGYDNSIYACIKKIDQTPVNGSAYWKLISYKNISYNAGNIVGYIDKLYRCKQDYNVNDPIFNTKPSLYGYDQKASIDNNKSIYWSIYNGQVWDWNESLANQGESYGTFTYYSLTDPNGVYELPGGLMPKAIIGGERIVLNNQLTRASYADGEYLGSPYNGIYTTDISSQHSYEEYDTSNTYKYGDMVLYDGFIYCCTGVVQGVEPGTTENWSRYWIGTQSSNNANDYSPDVVYKKDDVVQIPIDEDDSGNIIYSYYICLGTVLGRTPSESSIYWVKNARNGYRVTIRFNRAPDADSWGELMTKIVYVSGGNTFYGKNIQIKAPNEDGTIDTSDGYGVINQTPFKFTEEEPVEIYKYSFDKFNILKSYNVGDIVLYNNKKYICIKKTIPVLTGIINTAYWRDCTNDIINTTGLIFYNNPVTTSNKNGILYVRYFEGIQKGMMLQKLSNDNKYQYFIIDDVGTNGGMYLKYHEVKEFDTYKPYTTSNTVENANPIKLTADTTWDIDETKYQIKTYFRESDENAFYFYSRPLVDIQFENTNGVNFTTDKTPLIEAYEWEDGRIYGAGDYVYKDIGTSEPYIRTYYLCLVNNVKDVDPSNTTASAGKWLNTGTDGIRNYEYALYYVSGAEYKVGDYVYLSIDDKITYYKCLKDNTTDAPNKTGGTSDWLEIPLDINYKKDTIVKYNEVYYIALTNISQLAEPVKPEKENLGIFWEPYIGVLFREDIGFTYSLYNDLKVYDKDSVVYYEGKYYYTKKDITSIQPPVIYEENKNYNMGDIVWINIGGNILYYKAIREINQTESPIIPEQDVADPWELYNNFSGFIWNPYTNVQLRDEEGNLIKYSNGWTVVYKGVTYECVTSNDAGMVPEDTDTIDSFINNGSWIRYNNLDGNEIFIDGIRYNKNNTIYTEFNPKEMYLLNRVIYCDGLQYKVTSTASEYNANTEYKKGDYVSYDVDGVGIYEYYICISDEPIKNQAPVLKDQNNHKELNDNYWAITVINTLPKITDEEYFGKYISWTNTRLYNHGDIVLYNDVFYVYINENSQKMSIYNNATNYEIGDLVRYKESGAGTYKWQFYAGSNLGDAILCDITPEADETYPENYDSSKYWIPYYGFMYYGDYDDGISIGTNYYYNNVVKFNSQYYIYVNPNISNIFSVSQKSLISLNRLKEDIKEFKGEKKYNVGDIVLYNDKYYICYKDAGDWLYSPANTDYWTLFPWQIFISQIHERTIVCSAEYEQQQYIQWKSVQWFLCDDSGENILDKSEVIYDGDLTYTFHGVDGREKGTDEPVYFIIRLILETRTGYRMTVERKIEAIYEIEEIGSEGLISAYFDCDTMSIVTEVTKESGFIMPTISEAGTTITYSDGEKHENGIMSIDGEVNYEKVLYSLESISDIASARDITSDSDRFEIMGSHTINTDRFSGTIVSMSSSVANAITEEVQPKGYFKIYLPELLSRNVNNSQDTVLSREEIIVVNDDRNILKWEATDVNGQVPFEGVVEIRNANNSNGNIIGATKGESETGDLGIFFYQQNYITCSNWQPKLFSYSTKYPYTNYLPITYASCINSNSDAEQVSFNKYRNVRKTLNLYEKEIITPHFNNDGTINCSKAIIKSFDLDEALLNPCKRVQEPIMSISDNFKMDEIIKTIEDNGSIIYSYDENFGGPNKINSTIFGLSENMLNTEGATNKVYIIGSAPTLCSDFAYKETYGVYEGKDSNNTYIKKKNVMQDFSYAFSDESFDNGVGPEENIWNNDSNIWVDGDFILDGKSIIYNLGGLSINNTIIRSDELINGNIVKDGAYIAEEEIDQKNKTVFSDSQLGYQKPLTENDKEITEGGIKIDVITERGYLKGKTLIVDTELMMDGDGGITPYPIGNDPSATPEKLVVYVDPVTNFKPLEN